MKKRIVVIVCALALLLTLTFGLFACGQSEDVSYSDYGGEKGVSSNEESTEEGESIAVTQDRLIVYTVNENISVKDIAKTTEKLTAKAKEFGGWEDSSYTTDDGYASITFRIPTEKLEEFLKNVEGEGTVNNKRVSTEDITDSYTDVVAKKAVYEAQLEAYEKLLEDADNLNDVMTITDKINQIQAKIDNCGAKIEDYKNQAEYSTVTITIYELGTYEEPDYWAELGQLLQDSSSSVGVVFGFLLKVFVAILPYFAVLAGGFGLYVLIKFVVCKITKKPFGLFRRARDRRKARKERKEKTEK